MVKQFPCKNQLVVQIHLSILYAQPCGRRIFPHCCPCLCQQAGLPVPCRQARLKLGMTVGKTFNELQFNQEEHHFLVMDIPVRAWSTQLKRAQYNGSILIFKIIGRCSIRLALVYTEQKYCTNILPCHRHRDRVRQSIYALLYFLNPILANFYPVFI